MRHSPISRATFNRNGLCSMFYMFTCFSYFVQTLCIHVWLEAFFLIGIVTLYYSWFCTMIDVEQEAGQFCDNMAGTENDLNHVLSTFVDSEHEIPNFCNSRYVDMSELQSLFISNGNELILTLNIQSVNAKFNNLFPVINNLASQGLYFGAICLQETWTSNDSDLSLIQLPGYQLIHQGSICTKHGGLIIYLNESYSYKMRNLYTSSNIWEGKFIDINGGNLCRTLTIGNIYRPPHDNNDNVNIQQFVSELSPIMEILQSVTRMQRLQAISI